MSETPQLLMIEWVDRSQPTAGWHRLADIETLTQNCISVGFLIREDAQVKVLAANLGSAAHDEAWDQASNITTIPTASITRIRQINTLLMTAPKPRPLADAQWLRRLA